MEQASLNRKTIINQIIEISRPPVLNSYNFWKCWISETTKTYNWLSMECKTNFS